MMIVQKNNGIRLKYSKRDLRERVDGFRGIIEKYKYYEERIDEELFFYPKGLHGPTHIQRVLMLSLFISRLCRLSERQEDILLFCSMYHDIGRHHDGVDPWHGAASVDKMKKIKRKIPLLSIPEQEIATVIIQHHSIEDAHALKEHEKLQKIWDPDAYQQLQRLFPLFKDADNLDRVRINDLDERYLRREESIRLSSLAKEMFLYHQKQSDLTYFLK